MRYAVVIERDGRDTALTVLDLPGCVAVAETETEVRRLIDEAVALHVRGLREQGENVPAPSTLVDYVDVPTAA
jgi:predicted RNase H-like HicB family nuclease